MATAVAQATTTFDPYLIGLGAETETPQFTFGDIPFGAILRARRANGTTYSVYTTEHTTTDYLEEIWSELPQRGLSYYTNLRCRKVPPYFAGQATECHIHYYATHDKGLLLGINKTQFFTAQGVLRLF
jgi:hypothetical protein